MNRKNIVKSRVFSVMVIAIICFSLVFCNSNSFLSRASITSYADEIISYGHVGYDTDGDGTDDVIIFDSDDLYLIAEGVDSLNTNIKSLQDQLADPDKGKDQLLNRSAGSGQQLTAMDHISWTQVQTMARNNSFSTYGYQLGDCKSIVLDGNTYHMQLVNINTSSDITNDNRLYYPPGTADFVAVELLPESYQMNGTDTNALGWKYTKLRTYLNGTIWSKLSRQNPKLASVIIQKINFSSAGSGSTSADAWDMLWVPSCYEMGFNYNMAYAVNENKYCKRFNYFPTDASGTWPAEPLRVKKKVAGGSGVWWWCRSASSNIDGYFRFVGSSGNMNGNGGANSPGGVALCFRIG